MRLNHKLCYATLSLSPVLKRLPYFLASSSVGSCCGALLNFVANHSTEPPPSPIFAQTLGGGGHLGQNLNKKDPMMVSQIIIGRKDQSPRIVDSSSTDASQQDPQVPSVEGGTIGGLFLKYITSIYTRLIQYIYPGYRRDTHGIRGIHTHNTPLPVETTLCQSVDEAKWSTNQCGTYGHVLGMCTESEADGGAEKVLYSAKCGAEKVKYAHECRPCVMCGEPWCDDCDDHYADCECLGPNSEVHDV